MNWLAENALPIWMGGAVALTAAVVVYLQTGSRKALAGIAVVVAATSALLAAEWLLVTPREAVERRLYALAAAVESNDIRRTQEFLAPYAEVHQEAAALMPLVEIERARIRGTPEIELEPGDAPRTAVVRCRGMIIATVKRTGMKGGQEDRLTLNWIRDGDRWLLESYTSDRNWRRAVGR